MILFARIGDILERVLFPILEIRWIEILGQSIKNMIQATEDCWQVDQPNCFAVLTLQLHCPGKLANRSFAGSEHYAAPTSMDAAMGRSE